MGNHSDLDSPIFIWGAPRSGTTLLYEFIAKHPQVGYLGADNKKPREGTGFWWGAFGEHRGTMDATIAHSDRVRQIRKEYDALLRKQGKPRLLDKIPFMTLWIPLVNEVLPDVRHFHIIRDGRAVVNSVLYKLRYSKKEKDRVFCEDKLLYGPQPPGLVAPMSLPPALRHTRQWIMLVEQGRTNGRILGQRYSEIRYEDLVNAPRTTMKVVLNHAKLDYGEQFIRDTYPDVLTNRNYKWQTDSYEAAPDGFTAHRAITRDDLTYIEEMIPLLDALGYLDKKQ
jgi:hypothetical protein